MPQQPQSSPRVTDWWRTGRPHLSVDPDPGDVQDDGPEEPDDAGEPVSPKHEAVETAPTSDAPVRKGTGKREPKRTAVRKVAHGVSEDRRMRIVAFNVSAGMVGYGVGLVSLVNDVLPAAEAGAVGTVSLFTAAGGVYGSWMVTRSPAVQYVLPFPLISRILIAVGAAEVGRRFAPALVAWLNAYGQEWGLGPNAISLLLTTLGLGYGVWWVLDRRVRHLPALARWVVRIPLASILLATAHYTGTPVV